MAINVSFNGATIYRPGAYSKISVDLGGNFPLSPTGLIAIMGESTRGIPGSEEIDMAKNVFTPDQVSQIREKYGEGSLVDACNFLFSPASDGAVPSGAQAVWIYKTNHSVRAQLDLTRTLAADYGKIRAIQPGEEGNRITYSCTLLSESAPVAVAASDYVANAADAGLTFDIYLNGIKSVATLAAGTYVTAASVAAALVMPVGVTATAVVNKVNFIVAADALAAEKGYAKSLILSDSVPGDLALLGHVAGITVSSVEAAANIKISHKKFLLEETDTIGGNVVMLGGYTGANSTATVTIDSEKVTLVDAASKVYKLSGYTTVKDLIDDMNLEADWDFQLSDSLYGQLPATSLDQVVAVGAKTPSSSFLPLMVKKDFQDFSTFMTYSNIVEFVQADPQIKFGLPPAHVESKLTDVVGALGATSGADISNALLTFESIRVNAIIPLFSRDALDDIADGLTDSGSSYTIAAIHQLIKSHLSKMATTKQRSERQGYLSLKASFSDCQSVAANLADARAQLVIEDIRNTDSLGNIKWFLPWAGACNLAGARGGSPVGTPMTFKYMNINGIRHTAQPLRTPEIEIVTDFDPRVQYEQAIKSGITFLENPQTGGYRWVVDNTTYGKDGSWVFNRGNVIYAADVLAYDFRSQLEKIYVGVKNTVKASEVRSTCDSILQIYLAQGITVSTNDAPNGFKGLSVRLEGSTIYINVIVKLVEGIDFVLADITVQRALSEA